MSHAKDRSRPLGHRILEGAALFFMGQAFVLAVNLAATPYLVGRLGPDGYALYTLMWTVSGYLMLLIFGTGDAVQKYTAEYASRGPGSPLGSLLRSTLLFQTIAAVLGGAALYAARFWVAGTLFGIGPSMIERAAAVFGWVAAAAPAYFMFQFGASILYGCQAFRAYNAFQALQATAAALAACALLSLGRGLDAVAAAFLGVNTALAAACLWAARKPLGQPSSSAEPLRAEYWRFSAKRFANYALWIMTFQADRVFIGAHLPLSQMGYYVVSSSIIQKLNMFCGSVTGPAFPLFADLHGRGEAVRLRRFYLKVTELALFTVLPFSILAFAFVPQFFTLWLGPDFSRESTWPFRLLLGANLAYFCTILPSSLSVAKGAAEVPMRLQVVKLVVLLGLWPVLIPRLGIKGVALAFLAAEWLVLPFYLAAAHRRLGGVGWAEFAGQSLYRPGAPALALAALSLAVHGRVGGWAGLIGAGLAGLAAYWAATWWVLDREAKDLLLSWAKSKLKLDRSQPKAP